MSQFIAYMTVKKYYKTNQNGVMESDEEISDANLGCEP